MERAPAGPQLGSVSPAVARPGVLVTVSGANFGATPGALFYGGTQAPLVSWREHRIEVRAPGVTGGVYDMKVVKASGERERR